jgi:hypothetical protein
MLGLSVAACGGGGGGGGAYGQKIRPTFVEPAVAGESVSIRLADVKAQRMTHFRVTTPEGTEVFMAYDLNGKTTVRASMCPPCRSQSFSLQGNTLVCDSCGTVFSAVSGDGMSGACVAYPKASVDFTVNNEDLTMKTSDLITAYQNTLRPGKP